jgi:hypothetical protein
MVGPEEITGGGGGNRAVRDPELEVGAPSPCTMNFLLAGMGLPSLAVVRLGSTTAPDAFTNARSKKEHVYYLLVSLSAMWCRPFSSV